MQSAQEMWFPPLQGTPWILTYFKRALTVELKMSVRVGLFIKYIKNDDSVGKLLSGWCMCQVACGCLETCVLPTVLSSGSWISCLFSLCLFSWGKTHPFERALDHVTVQTSSFSLLLWYHSPGGVRCLWGGHTSKGRFSWANAQPKFVENPVDKWIPFTSEWVFKYCGALAPCPLSCQDKRLWGLQ